MSSHCCHVQRKKTSLVHQLCHVRFLFQNGPKRPWPPAFGSKVVRDLLESSAASFLAPLEHCLHALPNELGAAHANPFPQAQNQDSSSVAPVPCVPAKQQNEEEKDLLALTFLPNLHASEARSQRPQRDLLSPQSVSPLRRCWEGTSNFSALISLLPRGPAWLRDESSRIYCLERKGRKTPPRRHDHEGLPNG